MSSTMLLNVDLDLRAKSGLEELLKAFGSAVVVMNHEEEDFVSIEVASDKQLQSIDEAILDYYNIIHALPPRIRAIWDKCEMRSMNIGIQACTTPYSRSFQLSNNTISLLSSMNTEIVITVYADEPSE